MPDFKYITVNENAFKEYYAIKKGDNGGSITLGVNTKTVLPNIAENNGIKISRTSFGKNGYHSQSLFENGIEIKVKCKYKEEAEANLIAKTIEAKYKFKNFISCNNGTVILNVADSQDQVTGKVIKGTIPPEKIDEVVRDVLKIMTFNEQQIAELLECIFPGKLEAKIRIRSSSDGSSSVDKKLMDESNNLNPRNTLRSNFRNVLNQRNDKEHHARSSSVPPRPQHLDLPLLLALNASDHLATYGNNTSESENNNSVIKDLSTPRHGNVRNDCFSKNSTIENTGRERSSSAPKLDDLKRKDNAQLASPQSSSPTQDQRKKETSTKDKLKELEDFYKNLRDPNNNQNSSTTLLLLKRNKRSSYVNSSRLNNKSNTDISELETSSVALASSMQSHPSPSTNLISIGAVPDLDLNNINNPNNKIKSTVPSSHPNVKALASKFSIGSKN